MYILKKMVMFQRDHRIKNSESIADFILQYDGDDLTSESTLAVVAVDGVPFELNMSAAIILETILSGKDNNETARYIMQLFGIEYNHAISAVNQIITDFQEKNIIEKIL